MSGTVICARQTPGDVQAYCRLAKVGPIAENVDREAETSLLAADRLSEPELLALVKGAITGAYGEGGGMPHQAITGSKILPDKPLPFFSSDSKFAKLVADVQGGSSGGKEAVGDDDEEKLTGQALRSLLKGVSGLDEAVGIMCKALVGKLCSLLMIGREDVSVGKPVVAHGLDSLVAVELRNWITVDLEATVSLMELMGILCGSMALASAGIVLKNLVSKRPGCSSMRYAPLTLEVPFLPGSGW